MTDKRNYTAEVTIALIALLSSLASLAAALLPFLFRKKKRTARRKAEAR